MRLAILSTSRIVDEFLQHAGEMPSIQLEAICCRPQSEAKARAWAAQYGIPKVYTDEAAMYAAGGFDGVYIGTANHLHYPAAKRALEAGFHVMLEKPFTYTLAEAEELYRLADAKGVLLLEAITIPYLPAWQFLQQELPKIGPVRGAMASFCARSARYDDYLKGIWNTTFDPACQGGALADMNVYNLHLFCGLLGAPKGCEYRPSRGANGIDTAGLALLDYDGFTAAALAAKDSSTENGAFLQGPQGRLVIRGGTNALPEVCSIMACGRQDEPPTVCPKAEKHRMVYEFEEFARIAAEQDAAAEAAARARTLTVMAVLDALRANSK